MTTTISPQAETGLAHRYFLKNEQHEAIETSETLFSRVADAIAAVEDQYLTLPVLIIFTFISTQYYTNL